MSQKKKHKRGAKTPAPVRQSEEAKPMEKSTEMNPEEEKPFDFGGIPDRNLKKNLGCG